MTTFAAHTPVLRTARLTLRQPAPLDEAAVVAFYMSERSQYAGGFVPRFRACSNFFALLGHWQCRGFGLWAVTETGRDDAIIGLVGPYYPDGWPETECGWLMFDGHEGKGYAFEAAQAALQDCRTRLGWTDIVHYIAPPNRRSIALAERLGARLDAGATVPKPEDPCLVYRQPLAGMA